MNLKDLQEDNIKEIVAEIEYQKEDKTWIHSDIEPRGCDFKDIDDKHRKFLHDCLDEWINSSNGSGCFYIKDIDFNIET